MDRFIRGEPSGETIEPVGYPNGSLRVLLEAHTETSARITVADGTTTSTTEVHYSLSTGIFLHSSLSMDPDQSDFQVDFTQDLEVGNDSFKSHFLWREIEINGIPIPAQYSEEKNTNTWRLWLEEINLLRDGKEILGNLTLTGRDIEYCNSFTRVNLRPYILGRSKLI